MKQQVDLRLQELEEELQKGQQQLHELDQQRSNLEKTLLRISGAIQVLKELKGDEQSGAE